MPFYKELQIKGQEKKISGHFQENKFFAKKMMGEKFGFSRFFGDEGFLVKLEALEAARGGHS